MSEATGRRGKLYKLLLSPPTVWPSKDHGEGNSHLSGVTLYRYDFSPLTPVIRGHFLFLDENIQNFLHTAYKGGINSNQSTIVQLACSLFVQAGMQLSPQFIQQAAWWGNNTVQQTNFSDPNRTEAQIREWITRNTGGKHLETRCSFLPLCNAHSLHQLF